MRIVAFMRVVIGCSMASIFASEVLAKENDPGYCGPKGATFAHCKDHPVFKSVALTIHGWDGSCKSTFGEDKYWEGGQQYGSVYTLFRDNRFFDMDCFSYDSEEEDIKTNVEKLQARIKKLKSMGYENVMFITHSTGGIIAINYLLDRLDNAVSTKNYDTISIPAVIAWATPIKGLRWDIIMAGKVKSVFGPKQKILPHLDDDKPYLKSLRDRLKEYPANLMKLSVRGASTYRTQINYYQGQGDDWVVRSIKPAERKNGWLWRKPHAHLVDIDVNHLSNIGQPGAPKMYRYPGQIVNLTAMNSLPLRLNLNGIFPLGTKVYNEKLLPKQISMVKGVSYHAGNPGFSYDVNTLIKFLSHLLLNEFGRSKEVDYLLLEELKERVFSEKLISTDEDRKAGVIRFVTDVLGKFNAKADYLITRPGFGEPEFQQAVLKFAGDIFAELQNLPVTTAGLKPAQVELVNFVADGWKSPHGKVQARATEILASNINNFTKNTVEITKLYEKATAYYRPKINLLREPAKDNLGRVWHAVANRADALGIEASASRNEIVSFDDRQVPLWATFQSRNLDKEVVENFDTVQAENKSEKWKSEWAVTFAGISALGGSQGNQADLIKKANNKGFALYQSLSPTLRSEVDKRIEMFGKPAKGKGYYYIQKDHSPSKWNSMMEAGVR